jgi:hypothetical protein
MRNHRSRSIFTKEVGSPRSVAGPNSAFSIVPFLPVQVRRSRFLLVEGRLQILDGVVRLKDAFVCQFEAGV